MLLNIYIFFYRSKMNMVMLWNLMAAPEKFTLSGAPPWPTPSTLEFHGLCANRVMPHNQWYLTIFLQKKKKNFF